MKKSGIIAALAAMGLQIPPAIAALVAVPDFIPSLGEAERAWATLAVLAGWWIFGGRKKAPEQEPPVGD